MKVSMLSQICLLVFILSSGAEASYLKLLPSNKKVLKEKPGEIIHHEYYSLNYDEEHEQARWTMHELSKAMLKPVVDRTDDFREDPKVSTYSAEPTDYKYSGYDRGHMVPAGNMRFSLKAMSESFYMSNMSPQHPKLNRYIWRNLEDLVRYWAKTYSKVYVVTGPILDPSLKKINGIVSVPKSFYKVVYREAQDGKKESMIAFLFPNKDVTGNLQDFAVPVDKIEELTGVDFFVGLDNKVEQALEPQSNTADWNF
jgi:endonuclease G, mitochondrial